MGKLRSGKGHRAAQGEDHFLCCILVPASKKGRLEQALATATDEDLGSPLFTADYVPREDFLEKEFAEQHGRCVGLAFHRALTMEN